MNAHEIAVSKSFAAIGALPGAVGEPILNAAVAEDVTACLDDGVLDLVLADLAL